VSGRSLAELVRADGRLGPEEAIVVGGSVLRAVAAVMRPASCTGT